MSSRHLIPLGTASQVPTASRNHTAFFLRWDQEGILFDPGEGTQRQMTLAGLSAGDITKVCITHFHGDHCLGLPGVIQRLSLENVRHTVQVYFPASGAVYFDRLRHASIFAGLERLEVVPIEGPGVLYEDACSVLEVLPLSHEVDCYGYRWSERDVTRVNPQALARVGLSGPAVGRLLREGKVQLDGRWIYKAEVTEVHAGQSFAYVMDTRPCLSATRLARGADLLVCESTFLDAELELAARSGHMTAGQAGALARESGSRRLVLCHFSQRYADAAAFLAEATVHHGDVCVAVEPTAEAGPSRVALPPRRESSFHGDFEAHITVEIASTEHFVEVCERFGVKALQIELARGSRPIHPMTSSTHSGSLAQVRAEVDGLAERLAEEGFVVVRRKIEAGPHARGVPLTDEEARRLAMPCYFEVHLRLRIESPERRERLLDVVSPFQAHLSRNARRRSEEGEERFVTLRLHGAGRTTLEHHLGRLRHALEQHAFEVIDEATEVVVYDSDLDLDRGWLSP